MLNVLKQINLLNDKFCYVEFGAGKGLLTHEIAENLKPNKSAHILLERESRRNKFDKSHRDNEFFMRFRTDIKDFDINKMPVIYT